MSNQSPITLNINESFQFDDVLTLRLTVFSHKRPYAKGPTKATAYLTISKGEISEEVELSEHGEYREDGPRVKSFDSLQWQGYQITLVSMHYDQSIEVSITKTE